MSETLIFNLASFIIGTCFGSFLSVLIYRSTNNKKGIVKGNSYCPHCHHQLKPKNLIPLISYIFQCGRCSYCRKPISPFYPIIELISGLLFLANFNFLLGQLPNPSWAAFQTDWIFWLKLVFYNANILNLLAICFADLQKKAIPESFLYSWIVSSIVGIAFTYIDPISVITDQGLTVLVALLFFGGQYLISRGRWLGSGDIYFSAGMALLLGFSKFTLAVICSYFIGSAVIIILLIMKQVKAKQTIPFTPFLVMGTLVAFYYGNDIINWYFNSFLNINFF